VCAGEDDGVAIGAGVAAADGAAADVVDVEGLVAEGEAVDVVAEFGGQAEEGEGLLRLLGRLRPDNWLVAGGRVHWGYGRTEQRCVEGSVPAGQPIGQGTPASIGVVL